MKKLLFKTLRKLPRRIIPAVKFSTAAALGGSKLVYLTLEQSYYLFCGEKKIAKWADRLKETNHQYRQYRAKKDSYPYIDSAVISGLSLPQMLKQKIPNEVASVHFSDAELSGEILASSGVGLSYLHPVLALSFIAFSSYKRKDLSSFSKNVSFGERGSRMLLNSCILSFAGLPGIPIVFAKEFLLKKGERKKEVLKQMKRQWKARKKSYRLWEQPMTRSAFIKGLGFTAMASAFKRP